MINRVRTSKSSSITELISVVFGVSLGLGCSNSSAPGGRDGSVGAAGSGGVSAGATGGASSGVTGTGGASRGGATGTGGAADASATGDVGGKADVGGAGGGTGSPLAAVVSAYCKAARACCALAGFPAAQLADCETGLAPKWPLLTLLDLGQATIDATAAAACEAAYNHAATSCYQKQVISACTGIFVGTVEENQPCGKGNQSMLIGGSQGCKRTGGPEVCLWTGDSSDPKVTGICKKMVHGKKGDACVGTCAAGDNCTTDLLTGPNDTSVTWCFEEDGLYCSSLTGDSKCEILLAPGASCAAEWTACGSAGYCDSFSSSGMAPTCKPKGKLGQSCELIPCVDELSCSRDNKCVEPEDQAFANEFVCKGYPPALM